MNKLKEKYDFEVYYMIHPDRKFPVSVPDIDDYVRVQLAAYFYSKIGCENIDRLNLNIGMSHRVEKQEWGTLAFDRDWRRDQTSRLRRRGHR